MKVSVSSPILRAGLNFLLILAFVCGLVISSNSILSAKAATTINVTTFTDTISNDGFCSLREAIIAANTDKTVNPGVGECPAGSGADTIVLKSGTYTLTILEGKSDTATAGDLDISSNITIIGAGAKQTTVNGVKVNNRIFHVISGTSTFSDFTISGSNFTSDGSGIFTQANLTLNNMVITGNSASGKGGGIFNTSNGVLVINNSAIWGNQTQGSGGGGLASNSGTVTINNSTISGNTAIQNGGGIYLAGGTLSLNNVTIANNTANLNISGNGHGGGVSVSSGTLNLANTIIANNIDKSTSSVSPDCAGTLTSQGYNLIRDTTGCTISGSTTGNLTGVDPLLGLLQDNGGQSPTLAISFASPALNKGNPTAPGSGGTACLATDQRAISRPQDSACDIGAFELQTVTLKINQSTGGTITASPAGPNFPIGVTVTLSAVPTTGYSFVSWSGDCSGTTPTCSLTMNANKTVGAFFTKIQETLTIGSVTGGTISASSSSPYYYGDNVSLTANPGTGYSFVSWTGDCSGTTPTCNLVMNSNKTVGATFTPVPVTLSLNQSIGGTITATPLGPYLYWDTVTVTATPDYGYLLGSWTGNCTGTTSPCTLVLSGDKTVGAAFVLAPQTGPVFTVNNTGDSAGSCYILSCNLRQAIQAANSLTNGSSTGQIVFNLPGGGSQTFSPASGLPVITAPVVIDGTTVANQVITIDGSSAGASDGLTISGGGSTLRGLTITHFNGNGVVLSSNSNLVTGNAITLNGKAGVAILSGVGNSVKSNTITGNGSVGIDLGGDGATFNHIGVIPGPNNYQNYPVINLATSDGGSLRVVGTLVSAASQTYSIDLYTSQVCDASSFGPGRSYLGSFPVPTDASGNASFDQTITMGVLEPNYIAATATGSSGTSEFSYCLPVATPNLNWVQAQGIASTASAQEFLTSWFQEKWFKFPVQAGDSVQVTLNSLPGSAVSLHSDPNIIYNQLIYPQSSAALSASVADSAFLPSGSLPSGSLPSGSLPSGSLPSGSLPSGSLNSALLPSGSLPSGSLPSGSLPSGSLPSGSLPSGSLPSGSLPSGSLPSGSLPSGSLPSGSLPSGSLPSGSLPSGSLPSGSLPSGSLPSGSLPSGSLPSGSLPSGSLAAYSTAARNSLLGISMNPYATVQTIARDTYDMQGNLYVRVVGPFSLATPFTLQVTVNNSICKAIQTVPGDLAVMNGTPLNTGAQTLVLTDSRRLKGTSAEISTALADLQALVRRNDVNGVVIDLHDPQYQRVAWANNQADLNSACPGAKNIVATEIKAVIDAYRAANTSSGATTLQYIVLAGGANVIPFYQVGDVAGLANERDYVAPVAPSTPSEAGTKTNLVQGQDFYGSQTSFTQGGFSLPLPNLAVGRLVDTAVDISMAVNTYIATNGMITPQSSLVTGYDFVADAAQHIADELKAGTTSANNSNPIAETLIQPVGQPPSGPNAWTAAQLLSLLQANRHDIISVSGHFSAGSLVASDYTTTLTPAQIASANVNLTNVLVLALGCHSGYSIPNDDLLSGASPDPDWAKAFLRQGAAGFVASTAYAYGDTDLTAYGELLFWRLSQQLRTGSGPVSIGQALATAKRQYLAETAQMTGIDQKTLIETTLYGLPMMKVNLPGARLNPPSDTSIVTSTNPVPGNPAVIGLNSAAVTLNPVLTSNTVPLQNLVTNSPVTVTYLSGTDGVVANPYEPIYPKQIYNISVNGLVLRGVALRGGSYADQPGIVPLTSATTTETSSAHLTYNTQVFYPTQLWMENFSNALSGGNTRLIAIPAQFKSSAIGAIDGTLRQFNQLNLQLYYLPASWTDPLSPPAQKAAAISSAPVIFGASGVASSNNSVSFSVNTATDGPAGVQAVWILYTGKPGSSLYGSWTPLDLSLNSQDPTRWEGSLTLSVGTNPQDLLFMVQAVGGAGLTTLATNQGVYYGVSVQQPPAVQTTLSLINPPASGTYLQTSTFKVTLSAASGPVANQPVSLDIGGQQAFAITDSTGQASISLKPVITPGNYLAQASFNGNPDYLSSYASNPFGLNPDNTTINVTPASPATVEFNVSLANQPTPFVARVLDSSGNALGGKSVFFIVHNNTSYFARAAIADFQGNARLGAVPLPLGVYTVDVYFNGAIPVSPTTTLSLSDKAYISSSLTGLSLVIRDTTPPTITASAVKADNTSYSAGAWTNQSVTVHFSCSDTGSGVTSCPSDQVFTTDGSFTATGVSTDNVGNSANASFGPILIDKTLPISSGSVFINGNQATVTFSASDSLSGVASTLYSINGGPQQNYTAPFVVSNPGLNVIAFYSTDKAGNVEAAKSLTFTLLSILDTFNRANGSIGSNWGAATGTSFFQITNNQLDVQLGGPIYWKTAFGTSQQAFVTFSTIDPNSTEQGVLLKVQTSSVPQAGAIAVIYDAVAKAVRVETIRLNAPAWTIYPNQAAVFANGDRLGAIALANGAVQISKNGVVIATVTLNTADMAFFDPIGGSIGIWAINAPNAYMDDFGGGTYTP